MLRSVGSQRVGHDGATELKTQGLGSKGLSVLDGLSGQRIRPRAQVTKKRLLGSS